MNLLEAVLGEDLVKKARESGQSGNWSKWTAKELDELVYNPSQAEYVIKSIIDGDHQFPDNVWEALRRKYDDGVLANSISHYMVDTKNKKVHLHPSYIDRLTGLSERGRDLFDKRISEIHKFYNFPQEELDKAHQYTKQRKQEKASRTKLASKEEHSKLDLHPVMTEHWKKYMPEEIPGQVGPWEVVRSKLKTQDRQTIDMIMREMEKVGVIKPSPSGSKLFDPDAYKTLMARQKMNYPVRVTKDFRGTYHNAQMIRNKKANAALVSVGLPDSLEKDWKKNHPKLHDFIQKLRKSNHKSVMTAKNPIGWVRIDKLGPEDWLIEELQQDVDSVMQDDVGTRHYDALSNKKRLENNIKNVEQVKEKIADYERAIPAVQKWLEIIKPMRNEWDRFETSKQDNPKGEVASQYNSDFIKKYANFWNENSQSYGEAQKHAGAARYYLSPIDWWKTDEVQYIINSIKEDLQKEKENLPHYEKNLQDHRDQIEAGLPEMKSYQDWQTDSAAVKEFLKDFPRMALHAVKVAAKAAGVKRLWWVTYTQKKTLGGANPPKSWTSDALAKKFGFKKVPIDPNASFNHPSYPIMGTGIAWAITSELQSQKQAHPDGKNAFDGKPHEFIDDYFWMTPVDQMVTENLSLLGRTVFG